MLTLACKHSMVSEYRFRSDKGATMIEFAILLPIILLLFGLSVALINVYSATASLSTAVSTVRLGYTRAQHEYITDIEDAAAGSPPPNWPAPYLASDAMRSTAENYYETKFTWVYKPSSGTVSLLQAPKGVLYAMTYAYSQMQESVGENLEYPCEDPGCISCYPQYPIKHMKASSTSPPPSLIPVDNPQLSPVDMYPGVDGFDERFTGIVCDYYSGGTLSLIYNLAMKAIGYSSSSHRFQRRAWISEDFQW